MQPPSKLFKPSRLNPPIFINHFSLPMSRADRIALLLSLVAVGVSFWVTNRFLEGMPHLEDEFAYVWQARVIAEGDLTTPSPPHPKSFLVPFVVDHEGRRFGKYPLGWPVVLSFGVRLGLRNLVNPLLAGLAVWLTYRLGQKTLGETVGLLAAVLTLTSPFFLMNSGSLLSHPWGLVLSAAFAIAWLDSTRGEGDVPKWLTTLTAGFALGVLALSRPFTMLGVALPFGIHGIILLLRAEGAIRKRVMGIGLIALLLSSLHFLWQYALTGDPLTNPYTLWWEYDKIGFGPGYGVTEQGHNLDLAWINTKFSLRVGYGDLFGWGKFSWLFLPFGLWAIIKKPRLWPAAGVFPTLFVLYLAYWVGAWLFGPRYYFEGLYSLTLLSGAGIAWLAGWPLDPGAEWPQYNGWRKARPLGTTALVAILILANLIFYTPSRLNMMRGLYTIDRQRLQPFQASKAQALTPALIIVDSPRWMPYGALLELSDPYLESPFIFVFSRGYKADAEVAADFPDRNVFYYYPDRPYRFYTAPQPP